MGSGSGSGSGSAYRVRVRVGELLERGAQLGVVQLARAVLVDPVEGTTHVAGDGVGQPVSEGAHEPGIGQV